MMRMGHKQSTKEMVMKDIMDRAKVNNICHQAKGNHSQLSERVWVQGKLPQGLHKPREDVVNKIRGSFEELVKDHKDFSVELYIINPSTMM